MPKMYNPDTQETVDVKGKEVQQRKADGFVTVGNRPADEYEGKTREELTADDADEATEETQTEETQDAAPVEDAPTETQNDAEAEAENRAVPTPEAPEDDPDFEIAPGEKNEDGEPIGADDPATPTDRPGAKDVPPAGSEYVTE